MKVKVAKFHLYPKEEPTGFAVGFSIETKNDRNFYRDTVIPLEDVKDMNDEQIVQVAWDKMKEGILSEVERLEEKSSMLGKEFFVEENVVEENENNQTDEGV